MANAKVAAYLEGILVAGDEGRALAQGVTDELAREGWLCPQRALAVLGWAVAEPR